MSADDHSGFLPPARGEEARTAVAYLRTPLAIRVRAANVLEAGLLGELRHFTVDRRRIDAVADRVIAVTRDNYPSLRIPVHGRLGHFRVGKIDRVAPLVEAVGGGAAAADALFDLVMVSVLLDAGAGDAWRYREEATGAEVARSEGLAVASLRAFEAGLFSADPLAPRRVDAAALRGLDEGALARAFQVSAGNPLVGVAGRAELLRRLGDVLAGNPTLWAGGRPSGYLQALRARGREVRAADLLRDLLEGLAPIWPGRTTLGGVNLGDVWRHPVAGGSGPSAGLMPFHKLSQWLAYSLFEPIERGGLRVVQPGALTGLPEYRNGGLLVDTGVLTLKDPALADRTWQTGDELIVEWRALTVSLLDELAGHVREDLHLDEHHLPLARMLEGGTWAAGRATAQRLRGGLPPLNVASDGTIF